jgi:stage V sporulation protein AB
MGQVLLGALALGGGIVSAAGIFALITALGIVNRFAKVTRTAGYVRLYEEMIIFGAAFGNLCFLFDWRLFLGMPGVVVFGLISGIYVGCFAVCLAEITKAVPVAVRRTRISSGLGFIVLAVALGKGIGNLVYYLYLYVD